METKTNLSPGKNALPCNKIHFPESNLFATQILHSYTLRYHAKCRLLCIPVHVTTIHVYHTNVCMTSFIWNAESYVEIATFYSLFLWGMASAFIVGKTGVSSCQLSPSLWLWYVHDVTKTLEILILIRSFLKIISVDWYLLLV